MVLKTIGLRPGSVCHSGLLVLSCNAMQGHCDNCSHTPCTLQHQSPNFWTP